jgi:hypothetical protein
MMTMSDQNLKFKGRWFVTLYNATEGIKAYREGDNVVTTDGKSFLAGFLKSAAAAASTFTMRYVAIGTDSTAEAASNTALGVEVARVSAVVSQVTGAIYRLTGTFTSGIGTGAIVEYGVFSTATTGAGTIFSRDTESVVNKGANDELQVITEVTIS